MTMTSSISRRSFLKGSVATDAASLAACGGSDGSKKKIVRWGQGNPKLGLDMRKSTNSGSSNVSDPVFESLLRWTEETGERRTGKETPLAAARRITRIIRLSVNRVIAKSDKQSSLCDHYILWNRTHNIG